MMSSHDHGLSARTVQQIHTVLQQYPQVQRAVLFGSRAKGNFRTGSDVDLALSGQLDWLTVAQIQQALEDAAFPYSFSVVRDFSGTDADLLAHIRRVGKLFYELPEQGASRSSAEHF